MSNSSLRSFEKFYSALPCRKAELIDGQFIVGGSLSKSAMTLSYLLGALGRDYLKKLVPTELLASAREQLHKAALLPKPDFAEVKPFYNLPSKLAWDIRIGLHDLGRKVGGNTQVVKLGEDAFMPNIYILNPESVPRQKEYYLDEPPELAIEISTPHTRDFDYGQRLAKYAQAGLAEVWMLDIPERRFRPHVLGNAGYQELVPTGSIFYSATLAGFGVEHGRFFETLDEFGTHPLEIFTIPEQLLIRSPRPDNAAPELGGLAFIPRIDLEPVPIRFEEFISWGGEIKFEYFNGTPCFGGGSQTTLEWVGLLLMTLGLKWYFSQSDHS